MELFALFKAKIVGYSYIRVKEKLISQDIEILDRVILSSITFVKGFGCPWVIIYIYTQPFVIRKQKHIFLGFRHVQVK